VILTGNLHVGGADGEGKQLADRPPPSAPGAELKALNHPRIISRSNIIPWIGFRIEEVMPLLPDFKVGNLVVRQDARLAVLNAVIVQLDIFFGKPVVAFATQKAAITFAAPFEAAVVIMVNAQLAFYPAPPPFSCCSST